MFLVSEIPAPPGPVPPMIFELLVCLDAARRVMLLLAGAGIAVAAPECLPNCRETDLSGANLVDGNLVEAELTGASQVGADLTGANLRGAELGGATLFGADLTGANLSGAFLTGATLFGATLNDADLHGANLVGADPVWHASAEREPKRRGT